MNKSTITLDGGLPATNGHTNKKRPKQKTIRGGKGLTTADVCNTTATGSTAENNSSVLATHPRQCKKLKLNSSSSDDADVRGTRAEDLNEAQADMMMSLDGGGSRISHTEVPVPQNVEVIVVQGELCYQGADGRWYCSWKHQCHQKRVGSNTAAQCLRHLYKSRQCTKCCRVYQGPSSARPTDGHEPDCEDFRPGGGGRDDEEKR